MNETESKPCASSQMMSEARGPASSQLIATLAVACLFSAITLSAVVSVTAPIIARNKAQALQEAIFHVLSGSTLTNCSSCS